MDYEIKGNAALSDIQSHVREPWFFDIKCLLWTQRDFAA